MLKHARDLAQVRQQRKNKRRLYVPHIRWSKWLSTGGDEDEAMPTTGRKENRNGASEDHLDDIADAESINSRKTLLSAQRANDLEMSGGANETAEAKPELKRNAKLKAITNVPITLQETTPKLFGLRGTAADMLEWVQDSDDLLYAVKLAVAVFLVLWPAFVSSLNAWYSLNRGCKFDGPYVARAS